MLKRIICLIICLFFVNAGFAQGSKKQIRDSTWARYIAKKDSIKILKESVYTDVLDSNLKNAKMNFYKLHKGYLNNQMYQQSEYASVIALFLQFCLADFDSLLAAYTKYTLHNSWVINGELGRYKYDNSNLNKLISRSQDNYETMVAKIYATNKTIEQKDYLRFKLYYLLFGSYKREALQPEINTMVDSFMINHPKSIFVKELSSNYRMRYRLVNFGLGFNLGIGTGVYTKWLAANFEKSMQLETGFKLYYKNWFVNSNALFANTVLKNADTIGVLNIQPGQQMHLGSVSLGIGYSLPIQKTLTFSPCLAYGVISTSVIFDDSAKNVTNRVFGKDYRNQLQFSTMLELHKPKISIKNYTKKFDENRWSLYLKYAYSTAAFSKFPALGDLHNIAFGTKVFLKGSRRY